MADSTGPAPRWQRTLAQAVRDPDLLCDRLALDDATRHAARRAATLFPLVVPEPYLARIRPGDSADPLLRQVLPLDAEFARPVGFVDDPLREREVHRTPGLLHKYAGRVLLVVTGTCAIHCRYCFRRHFPYDDAPREWDAWQRVCDEIAADPTIEEVLLSGGDPLTRTDAWLARLAARLAEVPHVQRLRLHTRLPIVVPERVDASLLDWLAGGRLQPIVVVHANHPAEIDEACRAAFDRLRRAGVLLLNQSVLLRGVNDDADVLAELSRRLVAAGVLPYYLHRLDRVTGAAHFEVPQERGIELVAALRARLPGYAVPRFVREDPNSLGKTVLA